MTITTMEASAVDPPSIGSLLRGLQHLSHWRGQTIVIKYGGAAMGTPDLQASFAHDVTRLREAGVHPVIVHGGGPQIDTLLRRVGKTPRFVDGLRVTDQETMELVEMMLVGHINPELVGLINRQGGHAIGLNGKDSDLIVGHRHAHRLPNGTVTDLGFVGDVDTINSAPLRLLDAHGLIPVIAPVATGQDGTTYNINADHVAGMVAAALGAAVLLLLSDVPGILDRNGRILPRVTRADLDGLIRDGVIAGGMLPKVDAARHALAGGAARVRLVDGRHPHAVGFALLAAESSGTEIVR